MSEKNLSPLRKWLRNLLTQAFPNNATIITSNNQGPAFQAWTGMTQSYLEGQWKAEAGTGAVTTSCNSFLNQIVNKIQMAGGLAAGGTFRSFDLPVAGRNAWYWYPTFDKEPQSGDFFQIGKRSKPYDHVGVILDVDIGIWTTVEAGQGGPRSGYDSIKRKTGVVPPGLMGWINIDELFSGWRGPGSW